MSYSGAPHVAVIGGGLAGLSGALACLDGGARVSLFESQARLGGATYSFERAGRRFDNGQHVFLRCCSAYRGFLDRLGVSALAPLQERLAIPVLMADGRRSLLERVALPRPLELAGSLARYSPLSPLERLRVAGASRKLARVRPDDPAADARSFGAWLEANHQSERAVASFWDLLARPTINLPATECSLASAAMVFRTALLEHASNADVGWSRVPLSSLHGEPAEAAIRAAGGSIHTSCPVRAVVPEPGGWRVVLGDGSVSADAVVLALPHDHVAGVAPEGSLAVDPAALGHSAIVNLQIVFDRRVLRDEIAVAVAGPLQWLFDRSAAVGVEPGQQCVGISLSAAEEWLPARPADLLATFRSALARLVPAARGSGVIDWVVTKERRATFRAAPGSSGLRQGPASRLRGLALAGAWTDTGWPATMEGAVRSGQAAARAVLESCHRNPWQPKEVTA